MNRGTHLTIALAVCAFTGAVFIGGCSAKPKDPQLVTTIQSQMFADSQLKGSSLQVASTNGEVTLTGSVPNDAARLEAYKLATQTPGVTKVNDQMTVADQSAQNAAPAPMEPPPVVEEKPVTHAKPPKPVHHASSHENAQMASNTIQSTPPMQSPTPTQQDPPPAQAAATPAPPPPPPPQPRPVEVAAGTTVSIRMIDGVDSSVNKAGEVFHASLDAPIVVGDEVVVPKGADVFVRLANAKSAGKMTGQSELTLELVRLEHRGKSYSLVSTTYAEKGKSRGKDTATKVGGGAALGAIIGAIAGGGKGAAIGAAAGGGAGGVYQGVTHGQQVKIPAETKLDFQLDQPVTIDVMPRS